VLPVIALLLARLASRVFEVGRLMPAALAVFLAVPTFSYWCSSLPTEGRLREARLGAVVLWSPNLAWYAAAPGRRGLWSQQSIVDALCRDAGQLPHQQRALILLSHQYLNNANLDYLAAKSRCAVQIIGLPPELRTPDHVRHWIGAVHPTYVLVVPQVPEPELAPAFANAMKDEAERFIAQPRSGFELVYRGTLGGTGKEFLIYRRLDATVPS